jgi:hypothetical protein
MNLKSKTSAKALATEIESLELKFDVFYLNLNSLFLCVLCDPCGESLKELLSPPAEPHR